MTSRRNEDVLKRRRTAREELLARQQRQLSVVDDFARAVEDLDTAERRAGADAEVARLEAELAEARRAAKLFKTRLSPVDARAKLAAVAGEAIDAFGTAVAAADVLGVSPRELTRLAAQQPEDRAAAPAPVGSGAEALPTEVEQPADPDATGGAGAGHDQELAGPTGRDGSAAAPDGVEDAEAVSA